MSVRRLNIGVLTVRSKNYHPNRRLARAAGERGHALRFLHPYKLWCRLGSGAPALAAGGREARLDVATCRTGATVSDYTLALLRHLELAGVPVVNPWPAVALARNQFLTIQALAGAGLPVLPSHFCDNPAGFARAAKDLGGWPLVVKKVSGRQGSGVWLLEGEKQAGRLLAAELKEREGLVVQAFMPPAGRRDFRLLVVEGRVAGAMELFPKAGDFRANVHLGGSPKPVKPEKSWGALAIKATAALGLDIAGVDLMLAHGKPYVVEVNFNPGFRGLEAATGLDVAGLIIDCLARRGRKP